MQRTGATPDEARRPRVSRVVDAAVSELAEQLVAVATRQLHDVGAPAVTLRQVAAETGVSPTAVYLHDRSRAPAAGGRRARVQRARGTPGRRRTPRDRHGVIDAYVREALNTPSAYGLLTHSTDERLSAWPVLLAPLTDAFAKALHPGSDVWRPALRKGFPRLRAGRGRADLHAALVRLGGCATGSSTTNPCTTSPFAALHDDAIAAVCPMTAGWTARISRVPALLLQDPRH